jgi:hypothetical protein
MAPDTGLQFPRAWYKKQIEQSKQGGGNPMDIELADVTIHIDERIDAAGRENLENAWRALEGVVSVHWDAKQGHLAVVEYNPAKVGSQALRNIALGRGLHAELVGL